MCFLNCLHCGTKLKGLPQWYNRKYCSTACSQRYRLRLKKPDVGEKLWQHETDVFENAMEMHWAGLSSAAIARNLGIPVGTMYSWVHDFGSERERANPTIEIMQKDPKMQSLKEQFRIAQNAKKWLEVLRGISQGVGTIENDKIILVCGRLHGYSANKLAGLIYERLKENPSNGKTYAFCNRNQNAITTLSWNEPIYHIARYIKTHGTFIWPHDKLGKSIEVSRIEFDCLISLQKTKKYAKKS